MSGAAPLERRDLVKSALVETSDFALEVVECRCGDRAWSPPEPSTSHAIVFVRGGCFARRVNGVETFVDPTVVYFERPDDEQQIFHPAGGGDLCTVLYLSETLLAELAGGEPALPDEAVATDAATDLGHRLLLAAAQRGENAEDAVVATVVQVLERSFPTRAASGRPSTARARRRIVDEVREALLDDPGAGVTKLARRVAVSPHHLSRIFRLETGETVSRYRNRIRIRLALDRIAAGETCLARLAAELGFADQAHLARVIRAELDTTASELRLRLVGP
jgi:AraC-like DNA-binding protein